MLAVTLKEVKSITLTVRPGFLRLPWFATSRRWLAGVANSWMGPSPTGTLRTTSWVFGSMTATRSSCDSDTNARRPSPVNPTWAGPRPTGMLATCWRLAVSMTDTVPPLRLAT